MRLAVVAAGAADTAFALAFVDVVDVVDAGLNTAYHVFDTDCDDYTVDKCYYCTESLPSWIDHQSESRVLRRKSDATVDDVVDYTVVAA